MIQVKLLEDIPERGLPVLLVFGAGAGGLGLGGASPIHCLAQEGALEGAGTIGGGDWGGL